MQLHINAQYAVWSVSDTGSYRLLGNDSSKVNGVPANEWEVFKNMPSYGELTTDARSAVLRSLTLPDIRRTFAW